MRQASPLLSRHGIATKLVRCDLEARACPASVPSNGISAIVFKAAGREDYHGDLALDQLVAWACASVKSSLVSLRPTDLDEAISSPQSWFIVYFAPTSSPWRVFMRTFRQTTELVTKFGFNVRFGAIDCERFPDACAAQDQVNVLVAAVYYNGSDPTAHLLETNYHDVSVDGILEHVRDVISPPLFTVTPATWETDVIGTEALVIVAFMAGSWCGTPCADARRELKRVAKSLRGVHSIRIGMINCDEHGGYCGGHHVTEYPDVRLWKPGIKSLSDGGSRTHHVWAQHLTSWIADNVVNKVHAMNAATFAADVQGRDAWPWYVVFSCPRWCAPCNRYRVDLRLIAAILDARGAFVRVGHMDCDDNRQFCGQQGVHAYPTLRLIRPHSATLEIRNGQMDVLATADWIQQSVETPRRAQVALRVLRVYFEEVDPTKPELEIVRLAAQLSSSDEQGRKLIASELLQRYGVALAMPWEGNGHGEAGTHDEL